MGGSKSEDEEAVMKFLVLIKQVPEVSDIRFDSERKTLIREGVKNVINPYDRRAISEAIRYRNENGGEVVVASMGPPQARDALLEALITGADRAVHILDGRLAGSDTLVTSKVLASAAQRIGFDLILCGQHSTDSETAQVPPELAELLSIPCAPSVSKIEYRDSAIQVFCETDEGTTILELPLPALVTTAERLIKPIKVKEVPLSTGPSDKVEQWNLEDLGLDPGTVGLEGSPTFVAEIREQVIPRQPRLLDASDLNVTAMRVLEVIRSGVGNKIRPKVTPPGLRQGDEFWCLVESYQDQVRPVSLEILSCAASLASRRRGNVSAVVLGNRVVDPNLLSSWGAEKIYCVDEMHPDELVAVLCDQIGRIRPFAFLFPATPFGKYIAPRIAARLQLGLTGDCVGLDLDSELSLAQWKPAFGGNIVASIYSKTFPQMATIRPGALDSFHPRNPTPVPIAEWKPPSGIVHKFRIVARNVDQGTQAQKMEHSDVVICVGMGLGQENVPLAVRLAELLNGAVIATRRVVDSGWLPRQYQVGLTGKFIAPRAYLGLGVSGKFNHTIGIQKAEKIIAVNNDPNAEIFKTCDIGIVCDCVTLCRKLIELLEQNR